MKAISLMWSMVDTEAWRERIRALTGRAIEQHDRALARFFSKVEIVEDGCWLWNGSRIPTGYGRFRYDGSSQYAHRVLYEWVFGPLASGMNVCHHCDQPACVNPAHFFAGTQRENVDDSTRKGRRARHPHRTGEGGAFNPEVIAMVRELASNRVGQRRIGEALGMSNKTLRKLLQSEGISTTLNRVHRKLSAVQEQEVIARLQAGASTREVAALYGLHKSTVQDIARRYGLSLTRHSSHRH
jgi:hypothetical protein